MIIVIALSKGQKGNQPTVPAGIGLAVGLTSPQMANGIDAERRVEHKENAAHAG
jgi:hypothetical protein